MQLKPQFTFEQVNSSQDNQLHLVVGLTAPTSSWQQKRQPLCIIPVVDISGSMSGAKLDYAKRSLDKLVDHLSPDDYFALVSFSSSARVDFPAAKMTPDNKAKVKAIISKYHTEGSTNFSGGMLLGLEQANGLDLAESTLVRVIMFTDGQPTHGVTDQRGLTNLLSKQRGRASLSTFGYGQDACQDLLGGLATEGQGNYAFIRDPDSALSAFGKELGGLLSSYAQDIVVELTPHNGHQVTEILTDADVEEEKTGEVQVKVPSILSEETFYVVASVKLSAQKQPGPRQVNAFGVKVTYKVLGEDGSLETKTLEGNAKVQFVKAGEEQKTPTKEVDEIVARAQLVRAQVAAEAAAQRNDFSGAVMAFDSLDFEKRGLVGVAAAASHTKGMYGSAHTYGMTAGNRVGVRRAMARGMSASHLADEDACVLRSAGVSLSNSYQEQTMGSFVEPAQPAAPIDMTQPLSVGPVAPLDMGGVSVTGGSDLSGMSWTATNPPVELPKVAPVTPPEAPKSSLTKSRSNRW
jgi:Ca-activated chloride channel homolog